MENLRQLKNFPCSVNCTSVHIFQVSQLREDEAGTLRELLHLAKDTPATKLKGMISQVQEGIGGKIRRALVRDKPTEEVSSEVDDDEETESAGVVRGFFSRKK